MPPGRRYKSLKMTAEGSGDEDLISSLPVEVLHRVLYFLPPQEAGRTCVLSRSWREFWKSMTALRVSDDGRWSSAADFNNFINQLLLFRNRSRLLEFEFCTYYHPWMRFRIIGMSLPRPMVLDNVPLIPKDLKTLDFWSLLLDGCSMAFSGCDNLENLLMDDCRISSQRIFSEHLCNCVLICDTHTRICAPYLDSHHLDGNRGTTPFLESMPLLVTAFIRLGRTSEDLDGSERHVLLESLSSATNLELVVESGVKDLKWCPAFNKLKTLILNGWVVGHKVHSLIFVLGHAPILEKLIVELNDLIYEVEMEESCSMVQQFLPSEHLKIVEVRCIQDDAMVQNFLKVLKTYFHNLELLVSIGYEAVWVNRF
ncbi:hypothetical protein BS78_05G109700 [Paspalum vaginatum]|nr:hypothetical protein BS78_05G109700 [Paspalum vaginatum]